MSATAAQIARKHHYGPADLPGLWLEWRGEDRRDGADTDRDAPDVEAERVASEFWGSGS